MGPKVVVEFVDVAASVKFFRRVAVHGITLEAFEAAVRVPLAGCPDREDQEHPGRIKRRVKLRGTDNVEHTYTVALEPVEPDDGVLPGRVLVVSMFEDT